MGALVAVVVAVFLVLIIANWRDEPPSQDAEQLAAYMRDCLVLDDADNGYLHALGLDAALDTDPLQLGRERNAYIEAFVAVTEGEGAGARLPGDAVDYRSMRGGAVPHDRLEAALGEAALRSPYDDAPFEWSAADGSVVFRGIEPGDRGQHAILY